MPDFEHGRVYFKQFGAERVKPFFSSIEVIARAFPWNIVIIYSDTDVSVVILSIQS